MYGLGRKHKRLVTSVSVGSPLKRLKKEIQTIAFRFYNFANQLEARGEYIVTPVIQAFGYDWQLELYPRGDILSSRDVEYLSCYLHHGNVDGEKKKPPSAKLMFRCMDHRKSDNEVHKFGSTGRTNYLKRSDVLSNCLDEDGTLVIEIDIQIAVDCVVWYPKLDIPNITLTQLYSTCATDDSMADVVFEVDGKEFPAHKAIISLRAKTIFELTKDYRNDENSNIVPIPDMESDIFGSVLEFVYCVQTPTIEDESTATKLLLAANRLGCIDLKLYVESIIVEKFLDSLNAANWLVLSDSHECPLLKESSMKVYISDASTVIESEGWSQIKESPRLLEEILKFCTVKQPVLPNNKRKNETVVVENLDVTSLRERLLEANLDIDGNQEILTERLKDYISSSSSSS